MRDLQLSHNTKFRCLKIKPGGFSDASFAKCHFKSTLFVQYTKAKEKIESVLKELNKEFGGSSSSIGSWPSSTVLTPSAPKTDDLLASTSLSPFTRDSSSVGSVSQLVVDYVMMKNIIIIFFEIFITSHKFILCCSTLLARVLQHISSNFNVNSVFLCTIFLLSFVLVSDHTTLTLTSMVLGLKLAF